MAKKWFILFMGVCMIAVSSLVFAQEKKRPVQPKPSATKKASAGFTDPITGMEFVLVKGGCYQMGDTFGDGSPEEELPVHEVCVDDFYLAKHHVTNEQFKKFIDATGYKTTAEKLGTGWGLASDDPGNRGWGNIRGVDWKHPLWPGDSIAHKMNHPVLQVSWYDAKEFTTWLSSKTGRQYRLAYEAEYEYAIRNGGKKHKFAWGDGQISGNMADISAKSKFTGPLVKIFEGYDDGYIYTSPVGSFNPNELGLYDMTGNAWSWVEDWFSKEYYQRSPKNNPHGPDNGAHKAARGGSWITLPQYDRASDRADEAPEKRYAEIGFRPAHPAQ